MSLVLKSALGLQGLGDTCEVTDANGNCVDLSYTDPTFVGPPLTSASDTAQANQAALLAAQQAVMSGAVGVPASGTPPTPQQQSVGTFGALFLLAAGFMVVGAFKR